MYVDLFFKSRHKKILDILISSAPCPTCGRPYVNLSYFETCPFVDDYTNLLAQELFAIWERFKVFGILSLQKYISRQAKVIVLHVYPLEGVS